jgi:hypothetical protein
MKSGAVYLGSRYCSCTHPPSANSTHRNPSDKRVSPLNFTNSPKGNIFWTKACEIGSVRTFNPSVALTSPWVTGLAKGMVVGADSGAGDGAVGYTVGRRWASMELGLLVITGAGTGGVSAGISLPGPDKRNLRMRMPTIGIERDPITLSPSASGLRRAQDSQKFRATSCT